MGAMSGGSRLYDPENYEAKILVVDDRPDKLLAFETILQELQQEIITANSGEEALKLVLEHEFAVVLLDVNMPGLDGLETAALIRKRKRSAHTPIIFITAYPDEMLTMQGYSLGAVDYILSPVVPEILRTKVKVFVDLFCMTQRAKRQVDERIALAREQAARAAAEEASRRSILLADATRALFSSLDFWTTVHELFSLAVPSLADFCSFTAVNPRGGLERTELAWITAGGLQGNTSAETVPVPLAPSIEQALATRKPQFFEHDDSSAPLARAVTGAELAPDRLAEVPRLRSGGMFPLIARGRIVGVACFAAGSVGRVFSEADLLLLEDLTGRAAIALDNAQLYQQLHDADRHKNEFLAMLGHELRNPLTPIRNAAELLRRVGPDPQRLDWAQGVIERQVKHLARLVDDLLDVSRITRGKIELHQEPLEVSEAIRTAVEISRPLLESRGHRFTISVPARPLWIKADPGRIAQVLGNLLNNAAKYTPEGGAIALTANQEDNDVVFRVVDNGTGISRDMLSNIFDLFAQGERPPNSLHDGLGVGLTLVRHLVHLHGGSVDVFSAGPNKGSEFVVRLPLLGDKALPCVESAQPEVAQEPSNGLRVLVVDDNQDVAETVGQLLQWSGFEVQLAYDGEAALKLTSDFRPDAVLLDIGLPVIDGYEIARRLRAQPTGDRLIIIAASGYGQKEDQQRSLAAGCDRHLTKPIDPAQLTDLLNSLCSAKA
jgi:signal transduction histidine kinase/DNA-binding response OmpR family regulator